MFKDCLMVVYIIYLIYLKERMCVFMKLVVTIARSYGSGGKEIGKELAKTLGINYYGREIFEMSGGGANDGDDESIHASSLDEADVIFKRQAQTISEIAERESCVIVGRCADYVLRDMNNVVTVYLHAPLRDCMRRVSRLYELNPEDAKSLIHSMNKTRGDYYQHNTGRIWSDPTHYELCINTSGINTAQCIEIIRNYIDMKLE